MNPFVFVHIPKTAGTSFRIGADAYFGRDYVCRDYGAKSPETSEIVHRWVNGAQDKWAFKKAFDERGYRFLTGHFHAAAYAPLFGTSYMITFLRQPLQRLVSEYRHMVRNYGYSKSFAEFYRTPHNINRQQRMLDQLPWMALGFIGLTERYDESLHLLNQKYSLDISNLRENLGRAGLDDRYEIPVEQEQELRQLNAGDLALYDVVCEQFDWRLKLAEQQKGFVAGTLMHTDRGRLFGWALAEASDEPVEIQARVNGKALGEAVAQQDRPWLRAMGLGRAGYVGFSLDISRLKAGDRVECVVAGTGQPLVQSPWTVRA
ncbi:sulfotransferase family 2 domain-containing protein [Microbulbifer sp. Q7]|uniref:sulfotransferase family 2 domain-containing protein n=1 Tax=Microbulbifer sp. Q7 TaxID=1785091 RepID=UPI000A4B6B73|nr:sulfotransferase family 2 domain-containing protein [Microbulbifer sp. Q7]